MSKPVYPRAPTEVVANPEHERRLRRCDPGVAPDGRCAQRGAGPVQPLRRGLEGGQAAEHVRLANRALERLMRAVPQAGAHHG